MESKLLKVLKNYYKLVDISQSYVILKETGGDAVNKIQDDIFAIAIPVQDDYYYCVKDMIACHQKLLTQQEFVYFATDSKPNKNKLKHINHLLLYASKQEDTYYLATVKSILQHEEDWIPIDATMYTPNPYYRFTRHTWFQLTSIKAIDVEQLKDYVLLQLYTKSSYDSVYHYIQTTKRRQLFYFTKKARGQK